MIKWKSPYTENIAWYKGAIHIHTCNSGCGKYSPQEVVEAYGRNALRYDFITVTDHDYYTDMEAFQGENGLMLLPGIEESFMMSHIVTINSQKPRRLNSESYYSAMNLLSDEIKNRMGDSSYQKILFHINTLSRQFGTNYFRILEGLLYFMENSFGKETANQFYTFFAGIMGEAGYQSILDSVQADGGITIMAHPHRMEENYWDKELFLKLEGYTGIEIYSGDSYAPLTHVATDTWDSVLTAGKVVWGFGGDDFHKHGEFGKVWNVVNARSRTPDEVVRSLVRGDFYVSTGVELDCICSEGDRIMVKVRNDCFTERFEKSFRFIGAEGTLLHVQTGKNPAAVYQAVGNEKYIRVHVMMENGGMAYTQPFFAVPDK